MDYGRTPSSSRLNSSSAASRYTRYAPAASSSSMPYPPLRTPTLNILPRRPPSARDRQGAREEAATDAGAAVDAPGVDGHSRFLERLLPGDDVLVDRVDQRPIEVEDESAHCASVRAGSAAVISYGLM